MHACGAYVCACMYGMRVVCMCGMCVVCMYGVYVHVSILVFVCGPHGSTELAFCFWGQA